LSVGQGQGGSRKRCPGRPASCFPVPGTWRSPRAGAVRVGVSGKLPAFPSSPMPPSHAPRVSVPCAPPHRPRHRVPSVPPRRTAADGAGEHGRRPHPHHPRPGWRSHSRRRYDAFAAIMPAHAGFETYPTLSAHWVRLPFGLERERERMNERASFDGRRRRRPDTRAWSRTVRPRSMSCGAECGRLGAGGVSASGGRQLRCARCGSHLGHVFEGEGYPTPTDQRYCINSISLRLAPNEG
jgi:hypothetical protein